MLKLKIFSAGMVIVLSAAATAGPITSGGGDAPLFSCWAPHGGMSSNGPNPEWIDVYLQADARTYAIDVRVLNRPEPIVANGSPWAGPTTSFRAHWSEGRFEVSPWVRVGVMSGSANAEYSAHASLLLAGAEAAAHFVCSYVDLP